MTTTTPTTVVDLTTTDTVGMQGHTILVALPTGDVIDLWVIANDSTCSVDVPRHRQQLLPPRLRGTDQDRAWRWPPDRHIVQLRGHRSRMDWEDESYDTALDYVASIWQMSRNRLDHLLQVWCAVGGIEYPG